jgi:hypothetical protein
VPIFGSPPGLPPNYVTPRPSDSLLDVVSTNVAPTCFDYRVTHGFDKWFGWLQDIGIRTIRFSFGFDWSTPKPAHMGGGSGWVYSRATLLDWLTRLSRAGIGITIPTWGMGENLVGTIPELLSGAFDNINFIGFEGRNEPPAFGGLYPIPLQLGASDPKNRGDWTNSTIYAVGDWVKAPGTSGWYQCQVAHTSSANGPSAADLFMSSLWWPSYVAENVWFNDTLIPLLRARWPKARFVNESSFPDYDARGNITTGAYTGTKPSLYTLDKARRIEAANLHDYMKPGGIHDLPNGAIDGYLALARSAPGPTLTHTRGLWITETMGNANGRQGGPGDGNGYLITQQGAATTELRCDLWAWWAGVEKYVRWDLVDQPNAWYVTDARDVSTYAGLVDQDGVYKPSAVQLKYLLDLYRDTGVAFTPSAFRAVWSSSTPGDLAAVWAQKRDGTVLLATWLRRNVTSDPTGSTATSRGGATNGAVACSVGQFASGTYVTSSAAVSVTFPDRAFSSVRRHRPDDAVPVTNLFSLAANSPLTFTATERVQVYELRP